MTNPVAVAFTKQSAIFDSLEEENEILHWMREQVHAHCLLYFKPGNSILELNCGTGIDALFFARHGMHVHATDISEGMLNELRKKVDKNNFEDRISVQHCSYLELHILPAEKYDHVFSDFGGLNCVPDIEKVVAQFKSILKPGGTVTLVVMPPVCPWEMLTVLKGNAKTAFRRFRKNGAESNVEGVGFTTYYFSPSRLIKSFGKDFKKIDLQGLSCLVPPPYMERFPKKYPGLFKSLKKAEKKMSRMFPFNSWADHIILTMQLR
jgi:ubiquinone/menaquinone biosynthesis C-methylase UbiE